MTAHTPGDPFCECFDCTFNDCAAYLKITEAPIVDPKTCSDDDLRTIIESDPAASIAYDKELERREELRRLVDHIETKYLD